MLLELLPDHGRGQAPDVGHPGIDHDVQCLPDFFVEPIQRSEAPPVIQRITHEIRGTGGQTDKRTGGRWSTVYRL